MSIGILTVFIFFIPGVIAYALAQKGMLSFAKGSIDEAQLMALASDRCEQSEALFIAALNHIENDNAELAETYWQRIYELDIRTFFEFAVAKNKIKAAKK